MNFQSDMLDRLRSWMLPISCFIIIAYFLIHAVFGEHGARAYFSHQDKLDSLHAQRDEVVAMRQALEIKVHHMRPGSLDPDLLEEEARKALGFGREDELIVILPEAAE